MLDVLQFFSHVVENDDILSKYTTTLEFVNDYKIESIILMNVVRVLLKQNGMTKNLKIPFKLECFLTYIIFLTRW